MIHNSSNFINYMDATNLTNKNYQQQQQLQAQQQQQQQQLHQKTMLPVLLPQAQVNKIHNDRQNKSQHSNNYSPEYPQVKSSLASFIIDDSTKVDVTKKPISTATSKATNAILNVNQKHAHTTDILPPPIPKRTFRGKLNNAANTLTSGLAIAITTSTVTSIDTAIDVTPAAPVCDANNSLNNVKETSEVNLVYLQQQQQSPPPPPQQQQQHQQQQHQHQQKQHHRQQIDLFYKVTDNAKPSEEFQAKETASNDNNKGDGENGAGGLNDGGIGDSYSNSIRCNHVKSVNNFVGSQDNAISNNIMNGMSVCDTGIGIYDTGTISDDDHMSLENSVFEESINSTPIKLNNNNNNNNNKPFYNGSGCMLATKTLANLTNNDNNSLLNGGKRPNLSSCSTIDSSVTSSGYISHNERLTSSSTTNTGFRSRFSSDDTQSSLDNGLVMDLTNRNKIIDNNSNQHNDNCNNKINNNNNQAAIMPGYSYSDQGETIKKELPLVPTRKSKPQLNSIMNANDHPKTHVKPKLQPLIMADSIMKLLTNVNNINNDHNIDPIDLTVSNSTSTSSTVSGSSTISTEASSLSNSEIINNLRPQAPYQLQSQPKTEREIQLSLPIQKGLRPLPPVPPMRLQLNHTELLSKLSKNRNEENISNNLSMKHNQLKGNKNPPPPIIKHVKQDSNKSDNNYPHTTNSAVCQSETCRTIKLIVGETSNNSAIAFKQKCDCRQDSTISSDSFSQISSPDYKTKVMETPLLPTISMKRLKSLTSPIDTRKKLQNELNHKSDGALVPLAALSKYDECDGAKCANTGDGTTPTSLTIVRFQNGTPNTMALPHQIIDRRKSSNSYTINGRLKFRLIQILINALALVVIASCLAAYFNAYPTIKFVNKTIINTVRIEDPLNYGRNPAPGFCLPIIVKFCQNKQIPYNFTVFPNYIAHFGQMETQVDLEAYEALVDVRCYELVTLFLCTLFVPKCGSTGATVPPCKSLYSETMRRCGFFFDVFGLSLPEYLNYNLFKDFDNPEDCVGYAEVREVMLSSVNPKCEGFQCDRNRCIPNDYVCDGHLDCMDQMDEASCDLCVKDEIYCGSNQCISSTHICDGIVDCPYGQDERNCMRLSDRNGDLGKGILEVYRIRTHEWTPACVKKWDRAVSPMAVCSLLGYSSVNATNVITQKTHRPLLTSVNISDNMWKIYDKNRSNLMQELSNCELDEDYPIAELTCSNYECGKVKTVTPKIKSKATTRIVGGNKSHPGSWPFLAAILGGPEKIFYCAGVLISDQWILTASHCIGNHTLIDLQDWTIQLGITRRNSFTYSGQKVKVKTVIPHPLYNTAVAHDNDIALFQLSTRVAFHEHLLPVCLPPSSLKELRADTLCTVIGWGKREDRNPEASYEFVVNEVQVPIIKRSQCEEWLDNLTVSDGMICAGYEEGGKDACQGDSGGPLLCNYPGERNRWFVAGIVSWGIMCAHPKLPGVYANVIKYVPWIQEQIQKHSKPVLDEKLLKYEKHLDMLPVKKKKPLEHNQNRSPQEMEYYYNNKDNNN